MRYSGYSTYILLSGMKIHYSFVKIWSSKYQYMKNYTSLFSIFYNMVLHKAEIYKWWRQE